MQFTFAKIRLILYTHDEKTLQRQLEQSYIGNLDQAKPYNQKWLKQEKFNCYQCNFTFARINLVLYTHDEKTLQRQPEQSHIGNLDQAKPCDKKWPEAREIYMLSVQFYIFYIHMKRQPHLKCLGHHFDRPRSQRQIGPFIFNNIHNIVPCIPMTAHNSFT